MGWDGHGSIGQVMYISAHKSEAVHVHVRRDCINLCACLQDGICSPCSNTTYIVEYELVAMSIVSSFHIAQPLIPVGVEMRNSDTHQLHCHLSFKYHPPTSSNTYSPVF